MVAAELERDRLYRAKTIEIHCVLYEKKRQKLE